MNEALKALIYEALGEASGCWSERPTGMFPGKRATQIADELCGAIESYLVIQATGLEPILSSFSLQDAQGNVLERTPTFIGSYRE